MLLELAPLPTANMNTAPGQEATVAILPKSMAFFFLGSGILSLPETPERLCGLQNVTRASFNIVVNRSDVSVLGGLSFLTEKEAIFIWQVAEQFSSALGRSRACRGAWQYAHTLATHAHFFFFPVYFLACNYNRWGESRADSGFIVFTCWTAPSSVLPLVCRADISSFLMKD